MKEEIIVCDSCGKETKDHMKDGFIVIEGDFAKYGGRKKDDCAFTTHYFRGTHHFCSWKCLQKPNESESR